MNSTLIPEQTVHGFKDGFKLVLLREFWDAAVLII